MQKLFRPAMLALGISLAATPLFAQVKNRTLDRNGLPKNIVFTDGISAQDPQALLRRQLGLPEDAQMVLQSVTRPKAGLLVERYQQWIRGIRVAHGSFTLTAKDGLAKYMNGRVFPAPAAGAETPVLSENAALTIALERVGGKAYQWEDEGANRELRELTKNPDTSFYPQGRLMWVEDFSGKEPSGQLNLAWRFDIYATQPLKREEVFVSAADGKILLVNARLCHAAGTGASLYSGTVPINVKKHTGPLYKLEDTVRGGGIITKSYNNGTSMSSLSEVTASGVNFSSSAAVDAHWGAATVYDYWKTVHNRYSIDDADFPLRSYVNYDNNYNNAFWNGSWMTYGDGSGVSTGGMRPLTSMDVCAHEIGHGICSNTADLIYQGESGAMNESLSDMWAATIEAWSDPHETDATAKQYWHIGEEIGLSPFRRMDNPKLKGQPNTYNGTYWVYAGPGCNVSDDNCGVHTNSGVGNYWYYLLVNGGSGTNDNGKTYTVNGIGMDDAADLVYLTELTLSSTDQYADFRQATISAAGVLFGDCSPEQYAVDSAWYAVGVGDGYLPCVPNITFYSPDTTVTEWANTATCPATHEVLIPIQFRGPAATGGDAIATISVAGGTAAAGEDYSLADTSFIFPAGSTAEQYLPVTIYDNGAVHSNKTIVLNISINPAGSNVSLIPVVSTYTISIVNNDNRPDTGANVLKQVGVYDGTVGNKSSPFRSERAKARSQYLLSAEMLQAAGVVPGAPIASMGFTVSSKNSTQPFSGYTVKIGHTTESSLGTVSNWISGLTEVYNGDYTTTLGWNTIPFNSGSFTWDGVSNVAIEVCFNNTSAGTDNDKVYAYQPGGYTPNLWVANNTMSSGCAANFAVSTTSPALPVMRFVMSVPPAPVETSAGATRTWTVRPGQESYFFSTADSQVIAGVKNPDAVVTCLKATVTEGGNGFMPLASHPAINRSKKAIELSSAAMGSTGYEATFYYKTAELDGVNPANLYLLQTTAPTDADITEANSTLVTPVVRNSSAFASFKGNFTGSGRFFLVDGWPSLSIAENNHAAHQLQVASNPFHDHISIRYRVQKDVTADIQLLDVTGRMLYRTQETLPAAQQQLTVPVSRLGLAQGQYLLRVTTDAGVQTFKLLKQ